MLFRFQTGSSLKSEKIKKNSMNKLLELQLYRQKPKPY